MRFIVLSILLIFPFLSYSQSGNSLCSNAIRICLNDPVTYPASTNSAAAEAGPDYGCLGSEPNPAWFSFSIGAPGTHTINISNSGDRDLDFILYGPFDNELGNCNSLTAENTADCSYAGGTGETMEFTSINSGEFYLLMVTNFSNQSTNVSFTQTAGTGTFDCDFVGDCQISLITTNPGACDSLTNTFTLQGSVFTFNPPSSGNLVVSSGNESQVISGPFSGNVNFALSGLPSNGSNQIVQAFFSGVECESVVNFTAPQGCLPCQASAIAEGPVCEGEDLQLTTDYPALADYFWTGPNGFTSENPNPVIQNVDQSNSGTYSVRIEGDNCVSDREVEVEIIPSPIAAINPVEEFYCSGDVISLGAAEIPGADWQWTGPNGFSSDQRNNQILEASLLDDGWYYLSASRGGCSSNLDSAQVVVAPSPEITLIGDTLQMPGSTTIFYVDGPEGVNYFWNFSGNTELIETEVFTAGNDSLVVFWQENEGVIGIDVAGVDQNGCFSNESSLSVHVVDATSIHDLMSNSRLQVYPIPAKDIVTISNHGTYSGIAVLNDLSGRIVNQFAIGKEESVKLDVSNLESGVYVLLWEQSALKIIINK